MELKECGRVSAGRRRRRGVTLGAAVMLSALAALPVGAQGAQEKIGWAGFAFRSFTADTSVQFPLTSRMLPEIERELRQRIVQCTPEHFALEKESLTDWRKGETLSLACVLEFEQGITAPIYDVAGGDTGYLIGVVLSGQALFLDYKTSKVVESTPFTCSITNVFRSRNASDTERMTREVLMDHDTGFLAEFIRAATAARPNRKTGAAVLVHPVSLSDSAQKALGVRTAEEARAWGTFFANRIAASFAHTHKAAVMPSVRDTVTEQIRLRFADSSELELQLDSAAYTVDAAIEGVARFLDPKQSNAVRDVILYGTKGSLSARGTGPSLTESWQGVWGRAFVKDHQYTEGEPYYYRAITENALVDLVEKKLLASRKSRQPFEEILRKCRI